MYTNQKNNPSNKLDMFIKGSSILVLSNVCIKAINFFLLPLYTNYLSPTMIGISDSITTLTGIILPLLTMGLDSAFSAFYFNKDDRERPKFVFHTLSITLLVIGIIPFLLMFFSANISILLFNTKDYAYIINYALGAISFDLWYLPYSLELRLKNRMLIYSILNIMSSIFIVVLNIIFISYLKFGEAALILSAAIVSVEKFFAFFIAVKEKPQMKFFNLTLLKQMFRFSLPLVPTTIMMWILNLSDRYVILYYHGSEAVGIYGIGLRFVSIINIIISAVSVAYTSFAFASKDDSNAKKLYYVIFNFVIITLALISYTVSLFGKEIISLMTSAVYASAYQPLRNLLFSQTIYAMTVIIGYGLYFEKKSIYSLLAVSSGAIVNLAFNFILIPKYGINAAAFTTLVGYLINYIVTLFYSKKIYPCDYGENKIHFIIIVMYFMCFFVNKNFYIKCAIWLIAVVFICYTYKNIFIKISKYFLKQVS